MFTGSGPHILGRAIKSMPKADLVCANALMSAGAENAALLEPYPHLCPGVDTVRRIGGPQTQQSNYGYPQQ